MEENNKSVEILETIITHANTDGYARGYSDGVRRFKEELDKKHKANMTAFWTGVGINAILFGAPWLREKVKKIRDDRHKKIVIDRTTGEENDYED